MVFSFFSRRISTLESITNNSENILQSLFWNKEITEKKSIKRFLCSQELADMGCSITVKTALNS